MSGILIGYASVFTADQDLASQCDAPLRLGVLDSNIYVDHGLTGTNRTGPDCAKRSPPSGKVTRSWSSNSTGSPDR